MQDPAGVHGLRRRVITFQLLCRRNHHQRRRIIGADDDDGDLFGRAILGGDIERVGDLLTRRQGVHRGMRIIQRIGPLPADCDGKGAIAHVRSGCAGNRSKDIIVVVGIHIRMRRRPGHRGRRATVFGHAARERSGNDRVIIHRRQVQRRLGACYGLVPIRDVKGEGHAGFIVQDGRVGPFPRIAGRCQRTRRRCQIFNGQIVAIHIRRIGKQSRSRHGISCVFIRSAKVNGTRHHRRIVFTVDRQGNALRHGVLTRDHVKADLKDRLLGIVKEIEIGGVIADGAIGHGDQVRVCRSRAIGQSNRDRAIADGRRIARISIACRQQIVQIKTDRICNARIALGIRCRIGHGHLRNIVGACDHNTRLRWRRQTSRILHVEIDEERECLSGIQGIISGIARVYCQGGAGQRHTRRCATKRAAPGIRIRHVCNGQIGRQVVHIAGIGQQINVKAGVAFVRSTLHREANNRGVIGSVDGNGDVMLGAVGAFDRDRVRQRVRAVQPLNGGVVVVQIIGPCAIRVDGQRPIGAADSLCVPQVRRVGVVNIRMVDIARDGVGAGAVQRASLFSDRPAVAARHNRSVIRAGDGDHHGLSCAVVVVARVVGSGDFVGQDQRFACADVIKKTSSGVEIPVDRGAGAATVDSCRRCGREQIVQRDTVKIVARSRSTSDRKQSIHNRHHIGRIHILKRQRATQRKG